MMNMMKIKTFPNGRIVLQLDDVVLFEDRYVIYPTEAKRRLVNKLGLMIVNEEKDEWIVDDCSSGRTGDIDLVDEANKLGIRPEELIYRPGFKCLKVIERGRDSCLVQIEQDEPVMWAIVTPNSVKYYGSYWPALAEMRRAG